MKNNIFILTSHFPYLGGEQFLEGEIPHWCNTGFDNVYIIPNNSDGDKRMTPKNINVLDKKNAKSKYVYILLSFFNPILYKEFTQIVKTKNIRNYIPCFAQAIKYTAVVLREKERLIKTLAAFNSDNNTIYCYWNDVFFYASCLLKSEGYINHVVSRAHGFDLYEYRRPNKYMPLKRQFLASKSFDKVYLLTKKALTYYNKTYNAELNTLDISSLGVKVPEPSSSRAQTNSANTLQALSLSYCVPIKQIHLIAQSLAEYAANHKDTIVNWTHIGDGPLLQDLKEYTSQLTSLNSNFKANYMGELSNADVLTFLRSNTYDIFINASKSEGVPVSIMEAMSNGIPAVAPDVGGISALIQSSNGYLMPSDFNTHHIMTGIKYIRNPKNTLSLRENAFKWISQNFNSEINFPAFIKDLETIAGINEQK